MAEPLLFALVGDPLRAIARLLPDEDRFRARLACRTLREHADAPAAPIRRAAFLRTRALTAFACDALPGFMLVDRLQMLKLAAAEGDVREVPTLAISLEPKGGVPSETGPTGPVLFNGALIQQTL